ncbi:MAG TPA: metal ABC transporter permease [Acidimicrobiales bacterium]
MISLDELLRPFEFQFFQNGLLVATVAGALCGFIGVYVVLRSMSYIGHGLSHAIFGGFAVSALAGVNVFLGAGVWGLASALAVSSVTRRRPIGSDAAIGVITTASFAFGLAALQLGGGADVDADAALFGNVLGVTRGDVWLVSGVTLFAVAVVVLRYRSLLFVTFDPEVAEASGVRVARVDALLMLVLAASILATMNVMGVTLIAAALVVPAVVARMITSSFSTMLWLSALIGAVCGFVGMNLSYHLDVASGPTIVLVGGLLFLSALVATGVRGRVRLAGMDPH